MFSSFYRVLARKTLASSHKLVVQNFCQKRNFFSSFFMWLINIFNKVDESRLEVMGPDITCAEWLLRNGAEIRLKGDSNKFSDYNVLMNLEETLGPSLFRLEEVYAYKAGLNSDGFLHFKGCKHIKKVTLIFCSSIDNRALHMLNYVNDSLQFLEVNSCFLITDEGVLSLTKLRNLKELILANLAGVEDKEKCEAELRKGLINCKIDFRS